MTRITQTTNVTVNVGRRRWRFPLLGVIGFTIAMFWPEAVFHGGLVGGIAEAIWLVVLATIWSLVFVLRGL
jgi:hypothetical protein